MERWLDVPPGTGITLRHLADHTSGLPRLPPGLPYDDDPYASFDEDSLRVLLGRLDQIAVRSAGEVEEYSNLGYAVLGAALASATGESYQDVVGEYVLAPLGIDAVTAHPPSSRRLCAMGLFGGTLTPWKTDGAILPAGGMWATPHAAAALVTSLLIDRKLGDPAPTWQASGPLLWHNGATRRTSVFAGAVPTGGWVLIHRLGGFAARTDTLGFQMLAGAGTDA